MLKIERTTKKTEREEFAIKITRGKNSVVLSIPDILMVFIALAGFTWFITATFPWGLLMIIGMPTIAWIIFKVYYRRKRTLQS